MDLRKQAVVVTKWIVVLCIVSFSPLTISRGGISHGGGSSQRLSPYEISTEPTFAGYVNQFLKKNPYIYRVSAGNTQLNILPPLYPIVFALESLKRFFIKPLLDAPVHSENYFYIRNNHSPKEGESLRSDLVNFFSSITAENAKQMSKEMPREIQRKMFFWLTDGRREVLRELQGIDFVLSKQRLFISGETDEKDAITERKRGAAVYFNTQKLREYKKPISKRDILVLTIHEVFDRHFLNLGGPSDIGGKVLGSRIYFKDKLSPTKVLDLIVQGINERVFGRLIDGQLRALDPAVSRKELEKMTLNHAKKVFVCNEKGQLTSLDFLNDQKIFEHFSRKILALGFKFKPEHTISGDITFLDFSKSIALSTVKVAN